MTTSTNIGSRNMLGVSSPIRKTFIAPLAKKNKHEFNIIEFWTYRSNNLNDILSQGKKKQSTIISTFKMQR